MNALKRSEKNVGTTRKNSLTFWESPCVPCKSMRAEKSKSPSLAKLLDTTSTYLIGQRTGDFKFETMSDVMDCLFQLEKITGLHFSVDVKRPPYHDGWQCSIVFDGKEPAADLNADLCLFLESWKERRETFAHYGMPKTAYEQWKDQTLAYYAVQPVKLSEPEELETSERIKRRNEFLSGLTRDES